MKNEADPDIAMDRISCIAANAEKLDKPEMEAVSCLFKVSVSDADDEPAIEDEPARLILEDGEAVELPAMEDATENNSPGLSTEVDEPSIEAPAAYSIAELEDQLASPGNAASISTMDMNVTPPLWAQIRCSPNRSRHNGSKHGSRVSLCAVADFLYGYPSNLH